MGQFTIFPEKNIFFGGKMKFLSIFLVGRIWAHGAEGGHDHQKEIIDAFLKQERMGPERAVEKNCDEDDLPAVTDGIWKCNKKERCKFFCSTTVKPKPRPIYMCQRKQVGNGWNGYHWVKKAGEISENMCEPPPPPCGNLAPIDKGVW